MKRGGNLMNYRSDLKPANQPDAAAMRQQSGDHHNQTDHDVQPYPFKAENSPWTEAFQDMPAGQPAAQAAHPAQDAQADAPTAAASASHDDPTHDALSAIYGN
jgi:hypothetical protein